MSTKIDIRKTLVRAIVDISREKEFYGHIIQQFQREHVSPAHPIKTAAVGRPPGGQFVKLYLNDSYFVNLVEEQVEKALSSRDGNTSTMKARSDGEEAGWNYICGAMEHEIMHVALGHLFLKFDDEHRGNYALDCVVNSYLSKKCLHHTWIHPSRYDLPERKSAIWYYKELEKNPQYLKDRENQDKMKEMVFSHDLWKDVKDDDMAEEFIKDIIRKSKDLCGGSYGDIPGEIIQQIDDFLKPNKPIVPWNQLLRMFCARATDSILGYTQKRISRRFGTRPGTRKADALSLALIIDTSGSMSDEEIVVLMNEVYWIWRNGAKVTVYQCDTRVHKPLKYRGKWDGKIHGRGGTYFDLALDEVEGKYDAAIYFTDGWAPQVKRRYRMPVLFVLTTEAENPYSWSRCVRIPESAIKRAS
jgi:predicted metal-dependent peptidase